MEPLLSLLTKLRSANAPTILLVSNISPLFKGHVAYKQTKYRKTYVKEAKSLDFTDYYLVNLHNLGR